MKLNKVISIFAMAVAPLLVGATQMGCSSEDPTTQTENVTALTNYELNIEAMNQQYPDAVPIQKAEDVWTALVTVGGTTLPAPTHLFGDVINIIPYSNEDNQKDAQGNDFPRGDMTIAKYFKPGKVGIGLKMHRPERRSINLDTADAANMKEDFKLQDTHIELVVGVEKAEHGKPGAITLNNPQSYENGRFGDATYSMIFLEPVFPGWAVDYQKEYIDNTSAILVGLNAVSEFPGDYNGGDPLAGNTPDKVREYTRRMVLAITGDQESRDWFQDEANQVYCAELAFLAYSAGIITPLNKKTMEPLVGEDVWAKFVAEVDKHNKGVDKFQESGEVGDPSAFVALNSNKRVGMVRITLPAESLVPMAELAPEPAIASQLLALTPMTMADIVAQFMRTHIPRQILGEALAPAQAAVLDKMRPGLLEQMGMDRVPEDHPSRVAVNALYDQMVQVVGTEFASYQEFRTNIEPLMEQARQITGPRPGDEGGTGLFVPPSLFHVAAQGEFHGLLGFQYVGHGVHITNTQIKAGAVEEPEPAPEPEVTCAHDPCEVGGALTADNCALAAVTAISTADPYCKNTEWDKLCVEAAEAAQLCGE